MKNAEMKVLRFDGEDVIATSCKLVKGMSACSFRLQYIDSSCEYFLDLAEDGLSYDDVRADSDHSVLIFYNPAVYDADGNDITSGFSAANYVGQYFHYQSLNNDYQFNIQLCDTKTHQ